MNRTSRFGTAISSLAIAAVLSGCAAGQQSRESIFGAKVDRANIGLATRAQAALAEGELAKAVALAERAVENSPNDAGFRALLGNIYFASGRFASAEAAYKDSLTLISGQPEQILKLALVQIAQGRSSEALGLLAAAHGMLDPANHGLALALAGRPADAVAILDEVARAPGADARVRQNLALAHGLAGDWTTARTVAAQDVPPDQLDTRIQQWMAMATPARPSDQVAALTGVTPAADPGQPQRLALNRAPQQQQAQQQQAREEQPPMLAQPQPPAQQQLQVAEVPFAPPAALPEPPPQLAEPVPIAPVVEAPAPVVAEAAAALMQPVEQPEPRTPAVIEAAAVASDQPAPAEAVAGPVPDLPTSFEATVQPASYVAISDTVRRAAESARKARGQSKSVVQLGAYSSPQRVSVAWARLSKKYPALRDYTPMRARFDGPNGTVWRLSIKGFASQTEAVNRCKLLQSRGGNCFVRSVAGDSPVQFASR
jgi:D-alanyl-D-alanine carboxypeptidase